jgi:hypothetical protein
MNGWECPIENGMESRCCLTHHEPPSKEAIKVGQCLCYLVKRRISQEEPLGLQQQTRQRMTPQSKGQPP